MENRKRYPLSPPAQDGVIFVPQINLAQQFSIDFHDCEAFVESTRQRLIAVGAVNSQKSCNSLIKLAMSFHNPRAQMPDQNRIDAGTANMMLSEFSDDDSLHNGEGQDMPDSFEEMAGDEIKLAISENTCDVDNVSAIVALPSEAPLIEQHNVTSNADRDKELVNSRNIFKLDANFTEADQIASQSNKDSAIVVGSSEVKATEPSLKTHMPKETDIVQVVNIRDVENNVTETDLITPQTSSVESNNVISIVEGNDVPVQSITLNDFSILNPNSEVISISATSVDGNRQVRAESIITELSIPIPIRNPPYLLTGEDRIGIDDNLEGQIATQELTINSDKVGSGIDGISDFVEVDADRKQCLLGVENRLDGDKNIAGADLVIAMTTTIEPVAASSRTGDNSDVASQSVENGVLPEQVDIADPPCKEVDNIIETSERNSELGVPESDTLISGEFANLELPRARQENSCKIGEINGSLSESKATTNIFKTNNETSEVQSRLSDSPTEGLETDSQILNRPTMIPVFEPMEALLDNDTNDSFASLKGVVETCLDILDANETLKPNNLTFVEDESRISCSNDHLEIEVDRKIEETCHKSLEHIKNNGSEKIRENYDNEHSHEFVEDNIETVSLCSDLSEPVVQEISKNILDEALRKETNAEKIRENYDNEHSHEFVENNMETVSLCSDISEPVVQKISKNILDEALRKETNAEKIRENYDNEHSHEFVEDNMDTVSFCSDLSEPVVQEISEDILDEALRKETNAEKKRENYDNEHSDEFVEDNTDTVSFCSDLSEPVVPEISKDILDEALRKETNTEKMRENYDNEYSDEFEEDTMDTNSSCSDLYELVLLEACKDTLDETHRKETNAEKILENYDSEHSDEFVEDNMDNISFCSDLSEPDVLETAKDTWDETLRKETDAAFECDDLDRFLDELSKETDKATCETSGKTPQDNLLSTPNTQLSNQRHTTSQPGVENVSVIAARERIVDKTSVTGSFTVKKGNVSIKRTMRTIRKNAAQKRTGQPQGLDNDGGHKYIISIDGIRESAPRILKHRNPYVQSSAIKKAAIVIYPGPRHPLAPVVQFHLRKIRSEATVIDEHWANFAASAFPQSKRQRFLVPVVCPIGGGSSDVNLSQDNMQSNLADNEALKPNNHSEVLLEQGPSSLSVKYCNLHNSCLCKICYSPQFIKKYQTDNEFANLPDNLLEQAMMMFAGRSLDKIGMKLLDMKQDNIGPVQVIERGRLFNYLRENQLKFWNIRGNKIAITPQTVDLDCERITAAEELRRNIFKFNHSIPEYVVLYRVKPFCWQLCMGLTSSEISSSIVLSKDKRYWLSSLHRFKSINFNNEKYPFSPHWFVLSMDQPFQKLNFRWGESQWSMSKLKLPKSPEFLQSFSKPCFVTWPFGFYNSPCFYPFVLFGPFSSASAHYISFIHEKSRIPAYPNKYFSIPPRSECISGDDQIRKWLLSGFERVWTSGEEIKEAWLIDMGDRFELKLKRDTVAWTADIVEPAASTPRHVPSLVPVTEPKSLRPTSAATGSRTADIVEPAASTPRHVPSLVPVTEPKSLRPTSAATGSRTADIVEPAASTPRHVPSLVPVTEPKSLRPTSAATGSRSILKTPTLYLTSNIKGLGYITLNVAPGDVIIDLPGLRLSVAGKADFRQFGEADFRQLTEELRDILVFYPRNLVIQWNVTRNIQDISPFQSEWLNGEWIITRKGPFLFTSLTKAKCQQLSFDYNDIRRVANYHMASSCRKLQKAYGDYQRDIRLSEVLIRAKTEILNLKREFEYLKRLKAQLMETNLKLKLRNSSGRRKQILTPTSEDTCPDKLQSTRPVASKRTKVISNQLSTSRSASTPSERSLEDLSNVSLVTPQIKAGEVSEVPSPVYEKVVIDATKYQPITKFIKDHVIVKAKNSLVLEKGATAALAGKPPSLIQKQRTEPCAVKPSPVMPSSAKDSIQSVAQKSTNIAKAHGAPMTGLTRQILPKNPAKTFTSKSCGQVLSGSEDAMIEAKKLINVGNIPLPFDAVNSEDVTFSKCRVVNGKVVLLLDGNQYLNANRDTYGQVQKEQSTPKPMVPLTQKKIQIVSKNSKIMIPDPKCNYPAQNVVIMNPALQSEDHCQKTTISASKNTYLHNSGYYVHQNQGNATESWKNTTPSRSLPNLPKTSTIKKAVNILRGKTLSGGRDKPNFFRLHGPLESKKPLTILRRTTAHRGNFVLLQTPVAAKTNDLSACNASSDRKDLHSLAPPLHEEECEFIMDPSDKMNLHSLETTANREESLPYTYEGIPDINYPNQSPGLMEAEGLLLKAVHSTSEDIPRNVFPRSTVLNKSFQDNCHSTDDAFHEPPVSQSSPTSSPESLKIVQEEHAYHSSNTKGISVGKIYDSPELERMTNAPVRQLFVDITSETMQGPTPSIGSKASLQAEPLDRTSAMNDKSEIRVKRHGEELETHILPKLANVGSEDYVPISELNIKIVSVVSMSDKGIKNAIGKSAVATSGTKRLGEICEASVLPKVAKILRSHPAAIENVKPSDNMIYTRQVDDNADEAPMSLLGNGFGATALLNTESARNCPDEIGGAPLLSNVAAAKIISVQSAPEKLEIDVLSMTEEATIQKLVDDGIVTGKSLGDDSVVKELCTGEMCEAPCLPDVADSVSQSLSDSKAVASDPATVNDSLDAKSELCTSAVGENTDSGTEVANSAVAVSAPTALPHMNVVPRPNLPPIDSITSLEAGNVICAGDRYTAQPTAVAENNDKFSAATRDKSPGVWLGEEIFGGQQLRNSTIRISDSQNSTQNVEDHLVVVPIKKHASDVASQDSLQNVDHPIVAAADIARTSAPHVPKLVNVKENQNNPFTQHVTPGALCPRETPSVVAPKKRPRVKYTPRRADLNLTSSDSKKDSCNSSL